jgi:hypothetical protein
MNKTFISKASKPLMFSALALLLITQTGCFGSFSLTKKIYEFNKGLSSSKVVQSIAVLVLVFGGVYEFCAFVDVFILNLIEFWTGSNPVSMTEGQREEQVVMGKDGNQYKMIATKNQFEIVALSGDKIGVSNIMKYSVEEKTWSYSNATSSKKLVQMVTNENNETVAVNYFNENGEIAKSVSTHEIEMQHNWYAAAK